MDRTAEEFAKFSKTDADAYRRMLEEYERVAPVFSSYRFTPIGFGPTLVEMLEEHPEGACGRAGRR